MSAIESRPGSNGAAEQTSKASDTEHSAPARSLRELRDTVKHADPVLRRCLRDLQPHPRGLEDYRSECAANRIELRRREARETFEGRRSA